MFPSNPLGVTGFQFLPKVSPMNQMQFTNLLIVDKFSLSVPQEMYREQWGEYDY